jgi:hypothetical protein
MANKMAILLGCDHISTCLIRTNDKSGFRQLESWVSLKSG